MKRIFLVLSVIGLYAFITFYDHLLVTDSTIAAFSDTNEFSIVSLKDYLSTTPFADLLRINSWSDSVNLDTLNLTLDDVHNLNMTVLLSALVALFITFTFSFVTKKTISSSLTFGLSFMFLVEYFQPGSFRWIFFALNSVSFMITVVLLSLIIVIVKFTRKLIV